MVSVRRGTRRQLAGAIGLAMSAVGLAACSSGGSTATANPADRLVVTTAVGTDYGDAPTTTRSPLLTTTTAFVLPQVAPAPAPAKGSRGAKAKRPRKTVVHATGGGAVGPASAVRWAVKPSQANLPPGGHISGFVVAKNLGSTPGWIGAPGCASGPRPAARGAAKLCAPAGTQTRVEAGRSHTWEWTWNATVDGRRGSAPLAPGNYTFLIGGATVAVTVA